MTPAIEQTLTPTKNPGGTTSVIDDFEAANLDAYNYSVDKATAFNLATGTVRSGSQSLECVASNGGTDYINSVESTSGSPLNDYPNEGDNFEIWFNLTGDNAADDWWIHWAFTDATADDFFPDTGYGIKIEGGSEGIILNEEGGSANSDSDIFSWPTNEWARIDVNWTASTITATVFNAAETQVGQASISNSSNVDTRSFGFTSAADNVATMYYDDVQII